MTITTSALIVKVIGIIWILTLLNSLLVMLGGSRIFKRAAFSQKTAFYPIINLFTLMELSDVSTFLGIVLFVPGFNILVLMYMYYKLGTVFNMGFIFKIGLALFPIIFYPILAFGNYRYKAVDEKYFQALDNGKRKDVNLIIEEEPTPVTSTKPVVEEKTENVDSIFKTRFEVSEKAAPYKAVKIDLYGMDKLQEDKIEEDVFRPKIKVPPKPEVEIVDFDKNDENKEKKDNDFEVIDL